MHEISAEAGPVVGTHWYKAVLVSLLTLSLAQYLLSTLSELIDGDCCTVEPCVTHRGWAVSMLLPCPMTPPSLWVLQMVSTLMTLVVGKLNAVTSSPLHLDCGSSCRRVESGRVSSCLTDIGKRLL